MVSFCLGLLGFACLALAQFGHFKAVFSRPPSERQSLVLSLLGWGGLASSYFACTSINGLGYGTVLYLGYLALAGVGISLTLTFVAARLPQLMLVSGSMGTIALVVF